MMEHGGTNCQQGRIPSRLFKRYAHPHPQRSEKNQRCGLGLLYTPLALLENVNCIASDHTLDPKATHASI